MRDPLFFSFACSNGFSLKYSSLAFQNLSHSSSPMRVLLASLRFKKAFDSSESSMTRFVLVIMRVNGINQIMIGFDPFFTFQEFKSGLGSWEKPLGKYLDGSTFQGIYKFLKEEYESGKKIYPPKEAIFNAFKTTPIQTVKVVIVGQDPYHQPNQAHGLCFSVLKPVPPPPSLKNIYKNLTADPAIKFTTPTHGDLTNWATQGVFLLNASLTVEYNKPNSHAKCGWQQFTSQVIRVINENCVRVVYLLWGKPAQEKAKTVNKDNNCILKTSHPSPLSVRNGFETSRLFSACNNYLESMGKPAIDWNVQ